MTEELISFIKFTTERSGHRVRQGVARPRHLRPNEREREREREREILHTCQKNNQLCSYRLPYILYLNYFS